MPATITVEEAQAHLKELIDKLAPGEEVVITANLEMHPIDSEETSHAQYNKP